MKCDVIAEGVVAAAREVKLNVPLVVRLEGTNVDLGKNPGVNPGCRSFPQRIWRMLRRRLSWQSPESIAYVLS